jgi:hypothetical protein
LLLQILKPGLHPLDKIDMNELAKSESAKRRKEIYPRVKPIKDFSLSENFVVDAIEFAQTDLALFRHNCKYVAYRRKIPFTHLMRELNGLGIRISRETIVGKSVKKHTFPKSLLLSTFAFALDVPTWLLLSDNIESESERLGLFQ